MNINDVLCKKSVALIAVSSIHDGAPNRSARGMLKGKLTKNSEPLSFLKLDPKPDDVQGAIFSKCIIDRKTLLCFLMKLQRKVYADASTCLFRWVFPTFNENPHIF